MELFLHPSCFDGIRGGRAAEWRRALLGTVPVPAAFPTAAPATPTKPHRARPTEEKPGRPRRRWTAIGLLLVTVFAAVAAWMSSQLPQTGALPGVTADPAWAVHKSIDGARDMAKSLPGPGYDRPERERPPRERVERPGASDADVGGMRAKGLALFRAADTDGDGFLSPEEARRFPLLAKEFGRIDADGDGRISPQEFMHLRERQVQQRMQK